MKKILLPYFIFLSSLAFGQKKQNFLILQNDESINENFVYLNYKGDTSLVLDKKLYTACYTDTFFNFAIVLIKNSPYWWAVNKNKKILFRILNTSNGEPTPDVVRNDLIRIIGENNKIGFANAKGKIVLQPKFDFATSFDKGVSIIGQGKIKNSNNESIQKQYKIFGYINNKGKVVMLPKKNFDEIVKMFGWQSE